MATGRSAIVSSPVFHGDDPEQTTEYRTLSVLAIISLVIGLAAPLAIAGPFLLAIPLFGIAVSLVALRQIAVSGGVLAGRWAATAGLVLCIASAILPVSRDAIQRAIRIHQAEKFGGDWIALVTAGDLKEAFHLTVDATRPPAPPDPSAPPSEPNAPPKPSAYDTFIANPVIKALQAIGPNAEIRIRETLAYQATSYRNISVRQLVAVTPAAPSSSGSSNQPFEFVLSVQRAIIPRESMSRWLITSYDLPKPGADSTPAR
jgi:hypothetical protein